MFTEQKFVQYDNSVRYTTKSESHISCATFLTNHTEFNEQSSLTLSSFCPKLQLHQ